jgi:hypothetical protein
MWRLAAALVFLAFSFQSYVAQTHIHDIAATGFTQSVFHLGQNKAPTENSPLDCPFCQAATYAGSFFIPDPSLLLLAPHWMELAPLRHPLARNGITANHKWQSRAPPSR